MKLGQGRYVVEKQLGAGAFGTVYQAHDQRRDERVALKLLRRSDGDALYRFKREFRALRDVRHKNLVSLYELGEESGRWFFTMELVAGVDLLSWVGGAHTGDAAASRRLRRALEQLVAGIDALHRAGRLHRDLKPSNVRVRDNGDVVVLDFGLIASLGDSDGADRSSDGGIVGSAAYMAPEQAQLHKLSPAADFYAVGAMLYEALTARLPFEGEPLQILLAKSQLSPPRPELFAPQAARDLCALCFDLLARESDDRPNAAAIVDALRDESDPGAAVDRAEGVSLSGDAAASAVFVGREAELARLLEALDTTRGGQPVEVHVSGPSGIGKSALMSQLSARVLEGFPNALVLRASCYERELVPYRAIDGAIDQLVRHLGRLEDEEIAPLLPRDVDALLHLFPVFAKLEAVTRSPRRASAGGWHVDPQEIRRRGFRALRELFGRLSDRVPLALLLDDLQWGDSDSDALLDDLVRPPEAPALLLVTCYRDHSNAGDLTATAPLLAERRRRRAQHVVLAPLPLAHSAQLARSLLARGQASKKLCASIARESTGNPFFIEMLARDITHDGDRGRDARGDETLSPSSSGELAAAIDLGRVLSQRIADLPDGQRLLLGVIALAARPVNLQIALAAARTARSDAAIAIKAASTLDALHAARLVATMTADHSSEPTIATYHDRVRDAVVSAIEPARRLELHLALARVIEQHDGEGAAAEVLAYHYDEGGDAAAALRCIRVAAEQAQQALAFDAAAQLYRRAVAIDDRAACSTARDRVQLLEGLARALANGGHGRQAADAFRRAADAQQQHVGEPDRTVLRWRAREAEQLLKSGHVDEALGLLDRVLPAFELRLPRGRKAAIASLLWQRLRLRLRGMRYHERAAVDVPQATLARVDFAWQITQGITHVDVIRGASFQTQTARLALRCGELSRVHTALLIEATIGAWQGSPARKRTATLLARAQALADRLDDARAHGATQIATGVAAQNLGEYRDAARHYARARELLHDCPDARWLRDSIDALLVDTLCWAGEIGRVTRLVPAALADADRRGDEFLRAAMIAGAGHRYYLAIDQPDRLERMVADTLDRWSQEGFHIPHYWALWALTQADLYRGDAPRAAERMAKRWPALKRSHLPRLQPVKLLLADLRGRIELGCAAAGQTRRLREVLRWARRIEHERARWALPLAQLLRAGVARVQGETASSQLLLTSAADAFGENGMSLHENVARRALAASTSGADDWMVAQGIRVPARMAEMLWPAPAHS